MHLLKKMLMYDYAIARENTMLDLMLQTMPTTDQRVMLGGRGGSQMWWNRECI
jgi:hypothetical protein